jgi:hypothetical protein
VAQLTMEQITIIAAAVPVSIAVIATVCSWVFLRFFRIPADLPDASATLILPVTGSLPRLEELFDALLGQSLTPTRLIVATESREDPAYDRVADLIDRYPMLSIELVVAGLSDRRAQKCTNLLAAVARTGPADRYIVLFDNDILPQPWWLAALLAPLAAGRADIVNGYRWQVPVSLSPAIAIVAAIDRAISTIPRPDPFRMLWGGSIALTRSALEAIDLDATLARALTEDLLIADRAASLGLRVVTDRALRLPSPLIGSFDQIWCFARRQYQFIHAYRPGVWVFALIVCTGDLLARGFLLTSAIVANGVAKAIAVSALIVVGLLGSAGIALRGRIGRQLRVVDISGLALLQHFFVWAILPITLFHASLLWASLSTTRVRWAHFCYRVHAGRVIGVEPETQAPR